MGAGPKPGAVARKTGRVAFPGTEPPRTRAKDLHPECQARWELGQQGPSAIWFAHPGQGPPTHACPLLRSAASRVEASRPSTVNFLWCLAQLWPQSLLPWLTPPPPYSVPGATAAVDSQGHREENSVRLQARAGDRGDGQGRWSSCRLGLQSPLLQAPAEGGCFHRGLRHGHEAPLIFSRRHGRRRLEPPALRPGLRCDCSSAHASSGSPQGTGPTQGGRTGLPGQTPSWWCAQQPLHAGGLGTP